MSEHLSAQIVDEYCRRVMSPAELLVVGDHLATCEDCRRLAAEAVPMDSIVSSLRVQFHAGVTELLSDHLSYEQIAALVDNEIDEPQREALELHLDTCSQCAEEVKDLRAFRPEALAETVRKVGPAARPTLWQKIEAFMRADRLSQRPAFAAALALIILSVSVALFFSWRAARPSDSQQQTAADASPEAKPDATVQSTSEPSPKLPESANDSQILVAINDGGGQVTLDANGNLGGLDSLPQHSRQVVKQALTTERVEIPGGLSELIGTKGTLLGTDQAVAFSVLSPIATIIRSERPTLRWNRLNGATSYTVSVLDADFNAVATSPPLTATAWPLPQALERGRVYSWQVTAVKDGKEIISPSAPAPEARFKVLDQAKSDELRSVERAGTVSHLALGTLYARAGLLDDAERELRALVAANPNSATARKLLQSVRKLRAQ